MKKADQAKEFRADRFMTGGGHNVQYFPTEEAARAFLEENRDWCDTDRERKQFDKNGYFLHYAPLSGKVSFGVRDYYYDWEF